MPPTPTKITVNPAMTAEQVSNTNNQCTYRSRIYFLSLLNKELIEKILFCFWNIIRKCVHVCYLFPKIEKER